MNTQNLTENNSTNLFAMLWEASEEGAIYECTADQINKFIDESLDNDPSHPCKAEDVQVADEEVNDWIAAFTEWLKK